MCEQREAQERDEAGEEEQDPIGLELGLALLRKRIRDGIQTAPERRHIERMLLDVSAPTLPSPASGGGEGWGGAAMGIAEEQIQVSRHVRRSIGPFRK